MTRSFPTRRMVVAGAALILAGVTHPASAQSRERVEFAKGNDNAAVQGNVTGQGYYDYLLGAKAGQTMGVSLITDGSAYFNILPPGSNDVAIYNSSIEGNDATGIKLPASGDYTIRVYLMGADADGGATVPYTLSIGIS